MKYSFEKNLNKFLAPAVVVSTLGLGACTSSEATSVVGQCYGSKPIEVLQPGIGYDELVRQNTSITIEENDKTKGYNPERKAAIINHILEAIHLEYWKSPARDFPPNEFDIPGGKIIDVRHPGVTLGEYTNVPDSCVYTGVQSTR